MYMYSGTSVNNHAPLNKGHAVAIIITAKSQMNSLCTKQPLYIKAKTLFPKGVHYIHKGVPLYIIILIFLCHNNVTLYSLINNTEGTVYDFIIILIHLTTGDEAIIHNKYCHASYLLCPL